MATYRIGAKESVGYHAAWTLPESLGDITGWTFEATFERFAGDPDAFTLGMAPDAAAQGFRILSGPARKISARILADTIASYPDTTGRFVLVGDLLATSLSGERIALADFILTVLRGPTA